MRRYRTAEGLPGVALAEWQSDEIPDVRLSQRDLRLAERLSARSADARVDVRAIGDSVAIRTQGAVGLVRFDRFELQIEPKLPGGNLGLFRMIEFATGIAGVVRLAGSPRMRMAGNNLLDLVIELLAWLTEELIGAGLRGDYVTHEDDLPVLRGRFLPDRQVLERLGRYDRLVCRYDEHEYDVPDNQLLALALGRGARSAASHPVRRRARSVAGVLGEVCNPASFDLTDGRATMAYDRMNYHYKDAHELAWLLLEGLGPADELTSGSTRARSFLIDMNKLFERFVERALETILDDALFRIRAQRSESIFWDATEHRRYARVRPDLLVERRDRAQVRLPVDAKYKRYGGSETRKIVVADLSQAFMYAYAYRDPGSTTPPRAALVYPSERPGQPELVRLEVKSVAERMVDAQLIGIGVHIPTLLDELRTAGDRAGEAIEQALGLEAGDGAQAGRTSRPGADSAAR